MTPEISAREADVLALLGEHLSNAEIGARLYISVRTVESHVSSMLRKFGAADRRALAHHAAELARAGTPGPAPVLPAPLTSFIGRARERAALAALLREHRQVTAVGPGGVGKTRLALKVAAETAAAHPDGVWFVDLVSTTDTAMVAAAVAAALGLGEQPGRGLDESVTVALADRDALLVLDNCEQVLDGVAPFLERLLATCPRVRVLATSRARLMVPFERVYQVPSLSAEDDAVALFLDRASAAGLTPDASMRERIIEICRRLDGMALAIELAAARCAGLGLDGLGAGLSDPLRMLAGGSRADDRHRSVRAALDWSHALLEPADRALLRAVSVFVSPFTARAAAAIAGETFVADGLASLAEQSLLVVTAAPGGTEYRALETIRQYGAERLDAAGETEAVHARHLAWCLSAAEDLAPTGDWRVRFDDTADELRAALTRATDRPAAHRLARRLAELTFARGLIGESQQRHEQAAALAADPAEAAGLLRDAAAVAVCRMRGDDMYRLLKEAAALAESAGDTAAAARHWATAATHAHRFSGEFADLPTHAEGLALLDRAAELAGDDPGALAAVALGEAGVRFDAFGSALGPAENSVAETLAAAERAVAAARRTGDPYAESAALDTLTGAQSWNGDAFAVAATIERRVALMTPLPEGPVRTLELMDALVQSIEAALGVGDVAGARGNARRVRAHPLLAEVSYRATGWELVAGVLGGDPAPLPAIGEDFLDSWRRSGRPTGTFLGPGVSAGLTLHRLRGDEDAVREWSDVLARVGTLPTHGHSYLAIFEATELLHTGRFEEALKRLAPDPREVWKYVTWLWLHWYVPLRAEAAVLAGDAAAREYIEDGRGYVRGNPFAEAVLDRAEALLDGDRLPATSFAASPYQAARTLVLAGGAEGERGAALVAELGLVPMAPPPRT
ncbi:ATP-binding protein [Actinorhabdospora filicis]|uniref:ATP-binding protein n=1 Tax=Actinorhabdospora filicis TaxID=1785913 RepID=UPI00255304D5|nr:LuxR C-terminal-related transcriptional regulator [Actinorhabdospora filicis]